MGWDHCSCCCLRVWRALRQKITSVLWFLLWGTRAWALSLVLKERMLLMGKVVWSSCSLLPLLSQGLFPPFHHHEKQQTLVLGLELPCKMKRGWSSSMSPTWISVCFSRLPCLDQVGWGWYPLARISDAWKQSCFWWTPLCGSEGRTCSEKLSSWPEGRKAILQLPVIGLGVFYLTEFSATSSKAWTLRPSWWCQAEYVLELWYNLCTHTYLPMLSLMHFSLLYISDVSF